MGGPDKVKELQALQGAQLAAKYTQDPEVYGVIQDANTRMEVMMRERMNGREGQLAAVEQFSKAPGQLTPEEKQQWLGSLYQSTFATIESQALAQLPQPIAREFIGLKYTAPDVYDSMLRGMTATAASTEKDAAQLGVDKEKAISDRKFKEAQLEDMTQERGLKQLELQNNINRTGIEQGQLDLSTRRQSFDERTTTRKEDAEGAAALSGFSGIDDINRVLGSSDTDLMLEATQNGLTPKELKARAAVAKRYYNETPVDSNRRIPGVPQTNPNGVSGTSAPAAAKSAGISPSIQALLDRISKITGPKVRY